MSKLKINPFLLQTKVLFSMSVITIKLPSLLALKPETLQKLTIVLVYGTLPALNKQLLRRSTQFFFVVIK